MIPLVQVGITILGICLVCWIDFVIFLTVVEKIYRHIPSFLFMSILIASCLFPTPSFSSPQFCLVLSICILIALLLDAHLLFKEMKQKPLGGEKE